MRFDRFLFVKNSFWVIIIIFDMWLYFLYVCEDRRVLNYFGLFVYLCVGS